MAIYAPRSVNQQNGAVKVASLVEANPRGAAQGALSSVSIDGTAYAVAPKALAGRDGEVPYMGRSDAAALGYSPETIFRSDVYVCENDEDYRVSLCSNVSMREVFDTWVKGGRTAGKWYGWSPDYPTNKDGLPLSGIAEWLEWNKNARKAPSSWSDLSAAPNDSWRWPADTAFGHPCGYSFWYYAPAVSSIIQPVNTTDTSFYSSPYMMSSYDVTVGCRSYSDRDDDVIGIVAAEVKTKAADGTTAPAILTVNRSCNSSNTETTQAYAHFYIRTNGAKTAASSDWTPDPVYCDMGLSCTFFYTREKFQLRFSQVVEVSDVSANQKYETFAKTYGYGHLSDHPAGKYWPMLNPDPDGETFYRDSNGGAARDFWKTRPLTYEYEHRGTGKNELSLDLTLPDGMADPKNWWWLNDTLWDAHKENITYNGTWHNMGYCYMRVRRIGNSLTAWTTKMTESPRSAVGGDQGGQPDCPKTDADWNNMNKARKLTISLDADDVLFGVNLRDTFSLEASPLGGAVGFVTASQPGASWDIIDMKIPRVLVKTWTNQLIQYDPLTGEENVLEYLPSRYCGRGRLCRNNATGKTFYVCDSSFLKVSDPSPGKFIEFNGIKYVPAVEGGRLVWKQA